MQKLCTVIVAALALAASVRAASLDAAARIEVVSQTVTALSMRFVDALDRATTLDFTRATPTECWRTTSTALIGPMPWFGNPAPVYASPARCRSLGITAEQALTTFDVAICGRPLDDVTIFKTFDGMAIGLWRGRSIAEIWYVGSLVQDAVERAQSDQHMRASCENMRAVCCATIPNPADPPTGPSHPIPTPDIDACAGVANNPNCADGHEAVCSCAAYACEFCAHPAPMPPVPPCSENDLQKKSINACILYATKCGPPTPEPVPPPLTPMDEVLRLLQEILERLQLVLDRMPALNP